MSNGKNNKPAATESFNENYQILKNIAEQLRQQKEPDIDQLVPMIEQATAAYKVCQARLEAVKKVIAERLPGATEGTSTPP